jgi:hypothetical protein
MLDLSEPRREEKQLGRPRIAPELKGNSLAALREFMERPTLAAPGSSAHEWPGTDDHH